MDPASLSNLDPKLKETYERVMGTSTPATHVAGDTSIQANPVSSAPPIQPSNDSSTDLMPVNEPIVAAGATPVSPEQQPETVTINQPLPNPAASNIITRPHGHSGLIKIFYVLGATVFFVIYIFFWAKIFNISLPF